VRLFYCLVLFLFASVNVNAQKSIENFIFFDIQRDRIQESSFLKTEKFAGAQLKYTWKELEPLKDNYDFLNIRNDLDFLTKNGKKLFIQIQDVSFDTCGPNVPAYLLEEPLYHGGVNRQCITDDNEKILSYDGYVARRWDPQVAERFYKLLSELGKQFDGKLEGVNLPETAVDFGESGIYFPEGFTPEIYRDAILMQMKQAKQAFSKSVVIQYANFMPGEWLPWNNKGYLQSLYEFARGNKIGMGGPDIKIYKKAQMNHSYKFLKEFSGFIKTGIAVQDGNYDEINPKTGKKVTIEEIYLFGKDEIGLNYIFWCTQEPYYSKYVIPFFNKK
jgi:hypothetical protein